MSRETNLSIEYRLSKAQGPTEATEKEIIDIERSTIDEVESEEIDLAALKQSPYFGMKRYTDAVFFGELQDGKREGKGIMRYANGRVFEGEWQADMR